MAERNASRVFETAIARKLDADGVLATPIHAYEALRRYPRRIDVAQWWWFNPFGFTFCGLRIWDSDDLRHRMIGVVQWHPKFPDDIVYAAGAREQLMDPSALARAASGMFRRHARSSPAAILPSLPTGIDFRSANAMLPLLATRVREQILAVAAHQERRALLATCAFMEAAHGDPYQRCSMEMLGAERASLPRLRELASDEDAFRRLEAEIGRIEVICGASSAAGDGLPTEDEVLRWWTLVTDAAHLDAERSLISGS